MTKRFLKKLLLLFYYYFSSNERTRTSSIILTSFLFHMFAYLFRRFCLKSARKCRKVSSLNYSSWAKYSPNSGEYTLPYCCLCACLITLTLIMVIYRDIRFSTVIPPNMEFFIRADRKIQWRNRNSIFFLKKKIGKWYPMSNPHLARTTLKKHYVTDTAIGIAREKKKTFSPNKPTMIHQGRKFRGDFAKATP